MEQDEYQPEPGPIYEEDLSKLVDWIQHCDQQLDNEQDMNGEAQEIPCDFLLIGSKALLHYWTRDDSLVHENMDKLSPWRRKVLKNWATERFNKKDSDWDLICLNKNALVTLLKSKEFEEISVNYLVKMENFDGIGEELDWRCDSFQTDGEYPNKWYELCLRLQMFDGTIIEVEYCTHQNHLLTYLASITVEPFQSSLPLPLVEGYSTGLAPLRLLETIKKSHLFFNTTVNSENGWLKHIFDIELIRLLTERVRSESNGLTQVYNDRITKRIVKESQDDGDGSLCNIASYIRDYIFESNDDVTSIIHPINEDTLSSAFNISVSYMNPSYLGNDERSLQHLSQKIAAHMLTGIYHAISSDELEKFTFRCVQYVLHYNLREYLFPIIRDNFFELAERAFVMLDKPEIFKQIFDTNIEMRKFTFVNTPIDFINDEVKDISNLNGAMICNQYCSIEILMNIVSYISTAREIVNISQLDKNWNAVFHSEDVWKYLYFSRWPTPSQYSNMKSKYQSRNWKQAVLLRSNLTRVESPTLKGFEGLTNAFKGKFIGKSDIFKQFVNDFYFNTYIVSQKFSDDKSTEYKVLDATLLVCWPRQAPLKFNLTITVDYAWYRSGDSKGGKRETISVKLNSERRQFSEQFTTPISMRSFTHPEDFVGDFYLSNLKPEQYAPLFSTLAILGFGKVWTNEVLGSTWY